MNISDIKGALFDLDGVLIDSEGLYTEFWARIGKSYKLPSPTFAHDIKGCTLTDILDRYFPDKETQSRLTQEIHRYEDTMQYRIFPGVKEFLALLKKRGVRTAVVTSSDATKMGFLRQQHPDFIDSFQVVVNGSMVTKSKPDPEGYQKAADMLGLRYEECVVFEDSFQGLEAGRRLGGKVIALATTNSRERLLGLADMVIDSFFELLSHDDMVLHAE